MKQHSCAERQADLPTPTYAFAPGVVECHRRHWLGTSAQRRELASWLKLALLWGSVCCVVGLTVGWVVGVFP